MNWDWKKTLGIAGALAALVIVFILIREHPAAFTFKALSAALVMWQLVGLLIVICCIVYVVAPATGHKESVRGAMFIFGPIMFALLLVFGFIQEMTSGETAGTCRDPLSPTTTRVCVLDAAWTPNLPFDVAGTVRKDEFRLCVESPGGEGDYEAQMTGANIWRFRSRVGKIPFKYKLGENNICRYPL